MPSLSKKPRSHGVDPSPTPMMPTAGDSSTEISIPFLMNASAKIIAVIHPAVPPPTMTIFLKVGGIFAGRALALGAYEWLKTVAVGPIVFIAQARSVAAGTGGPRPRRGAAPRGRRCGASPARAAPCAG